MNGGSLAYIQLVVLDVLDRVAARVCPGIAKVMGNSRRREMTVLGPEACECEITDALQCVDSITLAFLVTNKGSWR